MTDRKRHFGGRVVSNGQTRKPKDFSTAPVMPNPAKTGSRDMFGGTLSKKLLPKMSYTQTVTPKTPKRHFWRQECYRLSIRHFWQDIFYTIPPNMSLEPVLAGFGITSAVERVYRLPAAAARSKMMFAVGRIRKCSYFVLLK